MEITVRAINKFFVELGIHINHKKGERGFKVKYLGWLLDTRTCIISCPPDKIPKITRLLQDAEGKRLLPARELASLVGMLTWLSFGC